ncbi:MAG: hypothetical protein Q8S00_20965 [Deltaproteobacteria bacterium]|nr:hypothetical protein [Deltaproteobacteria bacterium]
MKMQLVPDENKESQKGNPDPLAKLQEINKASNTISSYMPGLNPQDENGRAGLPRSAVLETQDCQPSSITEKKSRPGYTVRQWRPRSIRDSAEKPSVHPSRASGRTEGLLKSLEIFRSTELVEV